ncbi:uncharacterized protein LOC129750769 [Uranotaenia lowii]|uniref:uncharacterized protein LOC129750769 n=1 Tax=Uranotaenia lowii TaxID=190385 RepID=UPI00247A36C7|nr:uncharacterized protein LOC129750769 [Uranotaenia lowii]
MKSRISHQDQLCWTLLILLMAVGQSYQWLPFLGGFGGGGTGELSYFAGSIGQGDILCAKRLIGKGTQLPVQVPFATSIPIRAYSAEAQQYNRNGFSIIVESGAINSNTITLSFNGPRSLPYYIIVDFYCTPN